MPYTPKSPAEALLTTVGLPLEDVEKISGLSEDEQKTFDAKPYAEKVRDNYKTQLQNDPAFFSNITIENLPPAIKKQMESGQYARATNIAKEKIAKALGFTEEEIKDLATEDYKALDFYVPAITEKWTKTKSGDKQLQEQLIEARKKAEKYGPDYEKDIETKYQTQAEQRVTGAIFNAALIGELSTIPGLKIKPSTLAREANEILNSKYAFERVGDFSVELRQKANPAMKVLKNGSSQELTLKEALVEIATAEGWIEKEKESGKNTGKIEVKPDGKGALQMIPPHLQDKISKKIAAEQ